MDCHETLFSKVRVLRAIKKRMKSKIVLFSIVSIKFVVLVVVLGLLGFLVVSVR